jgi:hypothetical protein
MSKEVKRYGMCGSESGIVEMEDGPCVAWADYEALLAERDALAEALQYALDDFDRWASEPGSSPNDSVLAWVAKARAALQGAQP